MGALLASSLAKSMLCVAILFPSLVLLVPKYGLLVCMCSVSLDGACLLGCSSTSFGREADVGWGVGGIKTAVDGGPRWVVVGAATVIGSFTAIFSSALAVMAWPRVYFGWWRCLYLLLFFFKASTTKGGAAGGRPSPFKKIIH